MKTIEPLKDTDRKRLSGPAIRGFFKMADLWKLTADEQMKLLGISARSTFFKWKKNQDALLSQDTIERISYMLGIYKALHIIFSDRYSADSWLRRPNTNPLYGGRPPLDRMLSGRVADLYVVRQHLDAERGGWS